MKARSERFHPWVHRYAVLVACATFVLIIAGALVTSNDAALSVPSWPAPLRWPVHMGPGGRFELGHRFIAGTVSILTILLAVWLWRVESRRWLRRLGAVAVLAVFAQALLGGITVLLELPVTVSVSHACLGQIFFCIMVSLALFTGRRWNWNEASSPDRGRPSVRQLSLVTTALIFVQLVLGAAFRHKGFGVIPHVIGAVIVTVTVLWLVTRIIAEHRGEPRLLYPALLLAVLLIAQVLLGIGSYFMLIAFRNAPQPLPPVVDVTTAHVAVGALVLATGLVLTYQALRLLTPSAGQVEDVPSAVERAVV